MKTTGLDVLKSHCKAGAKIFTPLAPTPKTDTSLPPPTGFIRERAKPVPVETPRNPVAAAAKAVTGKATKPTMKMAKAARTTEQKKIEAEGKKALARIQSKKPSVKGIVKAVEGVAAAKSESEKKAAIAKVVEIAVKAKKSTSPAKKSLAKVQDIANKTAIAAADKAALDLAKAAKAEGYNVKTVKTKGKTEVTITNKPNQSKPLKVSKPATKDVSKPSAQAVKPTAKAVAAKTTAVSKPGVKAPVKAAPAAAKATPAKKASPPTKGKAAASKNK